jgi:hypothetical protein
MGRVWLVGLVLLLAGCGPADNTWGPTTSTTPLAAPSASSAPPASQPAKDLPTGTKFTTSPGTTGEIVYADFPIQDNFTAGMRKTVAQDDTIRILKYARTEYPAASRVFVEGHFPVTDDYGNSSDGVVLNVGYDRATLDKINFDGISPDQIWEIRDVGMVHPDLR